VRRNFFICLLLAGITLAIYWPVGNYDLVFYDDPFFFTENPEVQSGLNWHSVAWAMTGVVAANWHPVTSLSFVLDHQLFGTNPGAEHFVNVLFHAANAALLFLVLKRMTGATWRSAVVAALFAWHPLRVESVAWIAERKDVLCGFFFLLTLLCYTQAVMSGKRRVTGIAASTRATDWSRTTHHASLFYWLAVAFFALGLMSKAMVVTLPFLLVLLDIWPLGRVTGGKRQAAGENKIRASTLKHLLIEKWPFFALAALFCVVTFAVQHQADATPSSEQLGLGIRLENAVASYLRYIALTVWPANLAAYYPFPFNSGFYLALWPDWEIVAAAALLVCISALCVSQLVRRPYLAVGWFWYLGMMLPVIGLIQVGGQGMADRYTYNPLIGPVISLVWLVSEKWPARIFYQAMFTTLATMILAACVIQTRHQLQFWKNTVSLFSHTVDVTGQNARAEYILALGLEHEGDIGQAMIHYRIAMASQPTVKEAFYDMGRLLEQQGKWKEAEKIYSAMLASEPDDFYSHLGLVSVLSRAGRKEEAIVHLKAAMQTCPDAADAMNNLAWILATSVEAELRDGPRAVELAKRACELTGYRETIMIGTLAASYAEAGQFEEAIATAQKASAQAAGSGQQELLKRNQELLDLYLKHEPYREVINP
jgi:tetratricopeptide (TPR) repeat protein